MGFFSVELTQKIDFSIDFSEWILREIEISTILTTFFEFRFFKIGSQSNENFSKYISKKRFVEFSISGVYFRSKSIFLITIYIGYRSPLHFSNFDISVLRFSWIDYKSIFQNRSFEKLKNRSPLPQIFYTSNF